MSRELEDLSDLKGNKLILYKGDQTNDDRTFTFKKLGVAFNISSFNQVKFMIKKIGGTVADAIVPAFNCTVILASAGTVNVPFSTLNITETGEGLVAIIFDETATTKNRIKKQWKVDIVEPEVED